MEVADLVREVLKVLTEAEVPKEMQAVAFAKTFDALRGEQGGGALVPIGSGGGGAGGGGGIGGGEPLERIAQKLGVDLGKVERVYDYHDGEIHLAVHSNKLAPSKSGATKEIALLLSAGRQALGLDENGTPMNDVRDVAEHYKKYDSPNFSTVIGQMSAVMTVRGTGRDRTLKMTSPAWSEATELVTKLTDG